MEIKVGQTGTLFRLGSRKQMMWTIKGEPKMNPLYQLPNGQNAALRGDSGLIAGVPLGSTVMQREVEK